MRVEPVREGRELHTTTIRNENAYYATVVQLMAYHTLPRDASLPSIYLAGDSHALVHPFFHGSAWAVTP